MKAFFPRFWFWLMLAVSVSAALSTHGEAAVILGSFELRGDQEPNSSATIGVASYSLNTDQNRFALLMTFVGEIDLDGKQTADSMDDVTGLHINHGGAGAGGPIVFGIMSPSDEANSNTLIDAPNDKVFTIWDTYEGNGTTLLEQMAHLLAGELYVSVYTNRFPEGELRGQITVPVPEPATASFLGLATLLAASRRRARRQSGGALDR